jgi:signal transduction histidine kinase
MNKTSTVETEVLEVFHKFWDAYKQRDMDAACALCVQEITYFGSGAHEKACGMEEFKKMMALDLAQMPRPFAIEFLWIRVFTHGPTAWAESEVILRLDVDGKELELPKARASTFFVQQNDAWLVAHIHGSFPSVDQADGEAYPIEALNARNQELERIVTERTAQLELKAKELEDALKTLKDTQNQLILSEKMASLGQLTAGIAHEIKNPMNFVNNFAVLSTDLVKELREELEKDKAKLDPKSAAIIEDILKDLEQNVSKINEHGKRADSIVKGMLLHSRGKAGERQSTELNSLLNEYINLAYHGLRAQDSTFNVKIVTEYDQSVGTVNVVPQDLSRVFLNIVNNACYAANDKKKKAEAGFMPTISVKTKNLGDKVEIRIRDNGNGIPEHVKQKLFTPFFTTKPTGVGTGLGLSLSYDIITQGHKGEITVDSREGEYAEFIIRLPKEIS